MDFFQSQKLLANMLTMMGYFILENPKASSCWKSLIGNTSYILYAILLKVVSFNAVFFFKDPMLFPSEQHEATTFYMRIAESFYNQVCMIVLVMNNILKQGSFKKFWMILDTLHKQVCVDCLPLHRISIKLVLFGSIMYCGIHIPIVIWSLSTVDVITVLFIVLYVTDGLGFLLYQIYVLMLICVLEKMIIEINSKLHIAVRMDELVNVLQQHNGVLKCVVLVNKCFGVFMLITMFELFFTTICHLYFNILASWPGNERKHCYLMALRGITWVSPLLVLWCAMVTKCNSFAHEVSFCYL